MKHLLSTADLTLEDAVLILDTAQELAQVADRPVKKLPTLRGRTIVNLFFEDSTRTRISFEAAVDDQSLIFQSIRQVGRPTCCHEKDRPL